MIKMVVTDLDKNRVVKKFKDIEEIVNLVDTEFYDKDLNGKKILKLFLNKTNFDRSLYKLTKSSDFIEECEGFTLQDPKNEKLFYIVLRESTLFDILPNYFHELGHVANYDLKLSLTNNFINSVLDETLAVAYSYCAADIIQEKTGIGYSKSSLRASYEVKAQRQPKNLNAKPLEHAISFEIINNLNQIFKDMKKTYFWLKDSAVNYKQKLYNYILQTSLILKKCYAK